MVLQQAGLPATQQWVNLLSQGSAGLQDAVNQAAKFGSAADEQMIARARQFDESWNKSWTNFTTQAKDAVINVVNFFDDLEQKVVNAGKGLFGGGAAAPAQPLRVTIPVSSSAQPTVDPNVIKQQIALQQQQIAILGQLASVDDQVKAKELAIQQARLSGVNVTQAQEAAILALTRAEADGTLQMKAQADANNVELKALTMSTGEAAAYRAEQDKINEAKRLGQSVSQQTAQAWHDEATEIGSSAQALEDAQRQLQLTTDFINTFVSSLEQGKNATQALGASLQGLGSSLTQVGSKGIAQGIQGGLTDLIGGIAGVGAGAIGGPLATARGWRRHWLPGQSDRRDGQSAESRR